MGETREGRSLQDRNAIQFLLTKTLRGGRRGGGGDYPKIRFNEWGFYTGQTQRSDGCLKLADSLRDYRTRAGLDCWRDDCILGNRIV